MDNVFKIVVVVASIVVYDLSPYIIRIVNIIMTTERFVDE